MGSCPRNFRLRRDDRPHLRWPPMKESIAALAATAGLLIVSVAFGQQETSPAYKYPGDLRLYADLAKAPEKPPAKRDPFDTATPAAAERRNLLEHHCA